MSELMKPCIECGDLTDTTYCPEHRPQRDRIEVRDRVSRGYDHRWQKLSEKARRLQPFCSDCGATEDLQGDHSVQAWERFEKGLPVRLQDVDVVCGPCNRARGQSRPGAVDQTGPLLTHRAKAYLLSNTPRGYRRVG